MTRVHKMFPFEAREIEPEQREELLKYFTDKFSPSDVRYGPSAYLFTQKFATVGRDIYNMEVRPDDTFIVTFPKSGTTWTQELVWLIKNNFDYQKAKEIPLTSRYRFLELAMVVKTETRAGMIEDQDLKKAVNDMAMATAGEVAGLPSRRFFKSHLPLSLLPPNLLDSCKVIYVARDPRDVAVSLFHHNRLIKKIREDSDFKSFWIFFILDLVTWSPYFPHIKEAWKVRDHPKILFFFYEELSQDLPACARRVAKFLGKNILDKQMQQLCDHLHIDNFRNNTAVNLEKMKETGFFNENESFIRKGKVGGWREYFDEEMTQQAELWIQENLQNSDLCLPLGVYKKNKEYS